METKPIDDSFQGFAERVAEKWYHASLAKSQAGNELATLIASELLAAGWEPPSRWNGFHLEATHTRT